MVALEAVDELHACMGLSLLVDLVHMASGSRIGDKELSISLLFFGILAASIFFIIGFTILKK